jgi:hypothetical protein
VLEGGVKTQCARSYRQLQPDIDQKSYENQRRDVEPRPELSGRIPGSKLPVHNSRFSGSASSSIARRYQGAGGAASVHEPAAERATPRKSPETGGCLASSSSWFCTSSALGAGVSSVCRSMAAARALIAGARGAAELGAPSSWLNSAKYAAESCSNALLLLKRSTEILLSG